MCIYTNSVDVKVASTTYMNHFTIESGTSFAAPYISGFLAVVMSQSKFKLDIKRAKRILKYFSQEIKQKNQSKKYQYPQHYQRFLTVFPNIKKINKIRIFGKFNYLETKVV